MKKLLSLLLALLIPSAAFAQVSIWEKAYFGAAPGVQAVTLYGFNGAIPATFEAIWPESADYIPQVADLSTPYCASASANDTSAGTGARTIRIGGITTSWARFTETVTMNGQTSVNLTTTGVLLIDTGEVLTAGSGLMSAGIIQCGTGANTSGDPAVTHMYIAAGSETAVTGTGNKTAQFFYGVPANSKLICKNTSMGSVFATAASGLVSRIEGYTNADGIHKLLYSSHGHNTGTNPSGEPNYWTAPEKTIVIGKLAGSTGSNVGPASLRADCLLVDTAGAASNF